MIEKVTSREKSYRLVSEVGNPTNEKPWESWPIHRQASQGFKITRVVEDPTRKEVTNDSLGEVATGGYQISTFGIVENTYPGGEFSHYRTTISSKIIKETQLSYHNRDKGRMYNEIVASIGLDSPTPLQELRTEEGYLWNEYVQDPH